MIGMMRSPTIEFTIALNAAPMITPIARSTTLPFRANFLNSSSMGSFLDASSVQQPRIHHRVTDHLAGRRCDRHQRQAHFFVQASQQLEAMLGAGETGL